MDATQDREIWGDPYIGLRWAAEVPLEFARIAIQTPGFIWDAGHTTLGSPDIWADIKEALGAITEFFKMVWDVERGWYWPPTDRLFHGIMEICHGVIAIPSEIYTRFFGEYAPLVMWVDRLSDWWRDEIKPRFEAMKMALVGLPSNIYTKFLGEYSPLVMWVDRLSDWWRDEAKGWVEGAVNAIKGLAYEVFAWFFGEYSPLVMWVDRLSDWWRREAGPNLAAVINGIWALPFELYAWFFDENSALRAWVNQLRAWWTHEIWPGTGSPLGPLATLQAWWNETAWPFLQRFLLLFEFEPEDEYATVLGNVTPLVAGWFDEFVAIPRDYLTDAAELAGTDLALEPSRSLDVAGLLYAKAIAAGTGAHALATALNAIPALNWVGASQFAAYIAEAAGFADITKASYGTFLDGALAWPMRYHWNQLLRPKIPTEGAIYAMGRKRGLDFAEFSEAMAYHGLPQWWIDKEYLFFWADPSPYWLLRMSEQATPQPRPSGPMREWYNKWVPGWATDPMGWYRAKLKMAGFEDSDIDPFIEGFKRRRVAPAITRLKTAIRHMSREAYWDDWKVRDELSTLGVREDEITYLIDAERLQRQNDYLDDQVRYYNESFRKGEISRQDLSLALSTIIVKPEIVAQIVSREVVRALPKPKAVVPVREDPRVKSLVTQAVNSWTKGYRAWELEEEELEIGLNIVLQDPALAKQMVMVERTRYRPEPLPPKPPVEDPLVRKARVAAIASWVTQFREGKITVEVMELALANLIVDPDIVRLIRQIEELRAVPAPDILPPWEEEPLVAAVRQEAVRGHIEMFRKRLIDIDELYAYLLADGLAEPLARATALTQALKRIKTPPLESPYFAKDRLRELIDEAIASYTRMLELGQITMDEFEAYLAGAGVDPDVITYLGDTQEVRQFILLEGMA